MPTTIDDTLKRISRTAEEDAAKDLAARSQLPYALLDEYPFNLESLSLVPIDTVRSKGYAAYLAAAGTVRVALTNPQDQGLREELDTLGKQWKKRLELTVVSPSSLRYLITAYAKLIQEQAEREKERQFSAAQGQESNFFQNIQSLESLREHVSQVPISKLLDILLAAALQQEASDAHLEPGPQLLTVRFRIDGVLQKVLEIPMGQHHGLVSRIKILSQMKIDQTGAAQDGRFSLSDKGIKADVRVSSIPTSFGEGMVLRLLRHDQKVRALSELGFSDYNRDLIEKIIRKPYGLILVTGPTGSGKSTTLYSILQELNTSEKKIITLEDPVEYRLEGLQQTQVDTERGFTFAEALRGALRQDPDIVMVGEIRDAETATIALNAGLTGHLVLSTLHTNNAVTTHTRLLELGIEPYLLNGSIQMIIAQRLVRRLTPGGTAENPEYKGRLVVAEVLCPNTEFEQAVANHADQLSLEKIAEAGGMIPMLQDGLDKVKQGITTEAEVYRVTAA